MRFRLPASPQTKSRLLWLLFALLILLQGLLAWTASLKNSMTCDEIAHLTGGIALWHGDYRMVPENGNFPQRLIAIPAVVAGTPYQPAFEPPLRVPNVWGSGYRMFHGKDGVDHWPLLAAGRAVSTLFLMGVGAMVFVWARRWWGDAAGFTALIAALFCPNFLAHGALVNTDVAAALLLPLGAGVYWWHLHRSDWASRTAVIGVIGLACVSKYSAVLLLPTIVILDVIYLIARHKEFSLLRLVRLGLDHLVIVAGIAAIIWTAHGWRFSASPDPLEIPTLFSRPWAWVLGDPDKPRAVILNTLHAYKLLPEAYIYGAGYTAASSEMRQSFFNGELGIYGWVSFFPYAFAVKTPLPLFALCVLGLIAIIKRWRESVRTNASYAAVNAGLYRAAPLLVWSALYAITALLSHLNIGHRHLLPLYPGLFILAGAAATLTSRLPRIATGLALTSLAVVSLQIRPHYLAYFNPLDGGPNQAWKHLVDSSLDWGQDLPALKEWLDSNQGTEKLYFSYFGTPDPNYYGINAVILPSIPHFYESRTWYTLHRGYYAVSATMLQINLNRPWTQKEETAYQSLRQRITLIEDRKAPMDSVTPLEVAKAVKQRTNRLAHVFRGREPIAQPGYSILIYHLDEAEAVALDRGALPSDAPALP